MDQLDPDFDSILPTFTILFMIPNPGFLFTGQHCTRIVEIEVFSIDQLASHGRHAFLSLQFTIFAWSL